MQVKRIMQKAALLLVGILMSQTAFSQHNFLPGYVVSLGGDTLKGFIDYRNWEQNPTKISFQKMLKADKSGADLRTTYLPMDIKGFGVGDEIYKSAIIEAEVIANSTQALTYEPALVLKTDTAFLQAIIEGEKGLYAYVDKFNKEQFYIKQDSSYELLVHKRYIDNREGKKVVAINRKYLRQLSFYLRECPAVQLELKNVVYKKESIEKLFLTFYGCNTSQIEFHRKTEKVLTKISFLTGVSMTALRFHGENYKYLSEAAYTMSVNPLIGISFDFVLPRNHRKWSINNELILSYYKTDGFYNDYKSEANYIHNFTTIGSTYLKMNNMFRYTYPVGKSFMFFNTGLSSTFSIVGTNYRRQEIMYYTIEKEKESNAIEEPLNVELGIILGAGTKLKKLSFEVRYEKGTGVPLYANLIPVVNRGYFLVGYAF